MATIPQRELRDDLERTLRRAEAGERIVITVDGRPVAELGPVRGQRPTATLQTLRRSGRADAEWLGDLEAMRAADRGHASERWS